MSSNKRKIARFALGVGVLALCWMLDVNGIRTGNGDAAQTPEPAAQEQQSVAPQQPQEPTPAAQAPAAVNERPAQEPQPAPAAQAPTPAKEQPAQAVKVPAPATQAQGVVRDGAYYDRDRVAEYISKFGGALPKNYITKAQARELGWQGGPLEPYAPGKAIGGDRFGNYERRLPNGNYKECDIDTRGKPRGAKRLIFTRDGRTIYYTSDHYETFQKVAP